MNINIKKIQQEKPIKELLEFSIINLDKPTGPTSFTVSQFVKHSLELRKTSHLGTLDPMVSGVLPVALNRACRLNDYLMHRDKTYVGIMRLHSEISDKVLGEEIKRFIGKITQLPPVRSRVKRAFREREIKKFEILERDGKDVLFLAEVQAGTYIRKLCDDVGKNLGGAHMLELRRIKAGIFEEKKIINLYDFESAVTDYKKGDEKKLREILIPGEIISEILQVVQVNPANLKQILTGKPLFKEDIAVKPKELESPFALFLDQTFIGCYKITNEGDIFARPEFILN
ncbi:MAG TPA: RNA-guided pseudouridylation complex pseudouridine synthase subunit Cbf5 [Candidatus Nanoarchaeia archaeon]|nr:RNA-guided pseudouridylation complex pseudouridine synthase subunit Cbf5 [Candidatus Nanoarchaeia archaeon]